MAFNDTLFQLGMDLTRSSTTQEEDLAASLESVKPVRKDHFRDDGGARFAGKHLIIDLFDAKRLDDVQHVEDTLKRCVEAAGATLLSIHLHNTAPHGGVTGVAVLAESHISVHSWPESGYGAFDVFMSGTADPEKCVDVLREAFDARHVAVKEHRRGQNVAERNWTVVAPRKAPRSRDKVRAAKAA